MRNLGRRVGDIIWAAAGVVVLLIVAVFVLGFVRRVFAGTIIGRAAAWTESHAGLQG